MQRGVIKVVSCSSNLIESVLLSLNRESRIEERIELNVKINRLSPLYLGAIFYYGFGIEMVVKMKNRLVLQIYKREELEESIKPKRYSFLIKLPRTGVKGKRIYVYKVRTMQPYSEYLQDYVIRVNGLNDDGTIKDDFRITKFGRVLRKYWLDELPMLLNLLKGDLKLIGVRPLGDAMLSLYPKEFIEYRSRFKPGLIAPYYVDQPKSFEELIASEKHYLQAYEKNGYKTDLSYFIKFLRAFFIKGVRSC